MSLVERVHAMWCRSFHAEKYVWDTKKGQWKCGYCDTIERLRREIRDLEDYIYVLEEQDDEV